MMRLLMAAIGISLASAQQDTTADALLAGIRQNMRENLERLPDYTCRLTIERSTRSENARHFSHIDTVRMEVGYVGGRELYAWPGQRFENRRLQDMMPPGGAVGDGDFALHVRSIFLTNAAMFVYAGQMDEKGQAAVRFDYRVPREKSRYALQNSAAKELVGYHGSFWADAKTLRLMRLEIEAGDIPPQLKITQASSKLTYMLTGIGGADFLLPRSSELSLSDSSGRENRNLTHFEQCRQYHGESVLSFSDPGAETVSARPVTEVRLPGGVLVEMILRTELSLDEAAIGDPVMAVIAHDVVKGGSVIIPKGAKVTGRVTRVGRMTAGRIAYHVAGLRLSTVESPEWRAEFTGSLETFAFAAAQISVTSGERRAAQRAADRYALEPGESMLFVRGNISHIPPGAHMFWRTADDRKE